MNDLIEYTLHLADNVLVLGHRNSEWTGHGPILEQDIAISNIALDLVGQARNFYQYAAGMIGNEATEDSLAYLRNPGDFRNCLLVEQGKGDWGKTITRQFFFSAFQFLLFEHMRGSSDSTIAAIAEKSLKEVTYHLRWSSEWVVRLGDGTDESNRRMKIAIGELWDYTPELFIAAPYESACTNKAIAPDVSSLEEAWLERIRSVFAEALLVIPEHGATISGGKIGAHSAQLEFMLGEMQYLQREYPGNQW